MKKFNFIYLFLALVGVFALTSCEHQYADYTPGAQDANMGVYFPSTDGFEVKAETTSVDIVVARLNAEAAAEVSVRAEDTTSSGLFTWPTSVSFDAGQSEAAFTISFDGSKLELAKEYAIRVQLDQAEASTYATSEFIYTIVIPEPWANMGTGMYVDDFFRAIMAAAGSELEAGYVAPIKFQQHELNPNRIRVVNPASMELFGNLYGGVPGFFNYDQAVETSYIEFDITDPNNVMLAENPTYLNVWANFGEDGMLPLVLYVVANEDGSYAAPITLVDGVITFPKDNVVMGYVDGGLYGWNANTEGMMMYCLPGVELTDYTISADYAGMIVSADNKTTTAIIEFTLGSDVEDYKFVIVPGAVEDVDAVAASIVDGTAEGIVEATASQTQYQVELATGNYTIVAVPYAGGKNVGVPASKFFYFPGASTGEKPEAQVEFFVNSLANIFADDADRAAQMEANYPAEYFVGIVLGIANPEEITGLRFYYNSSAAIHAAIEGGKFASYAEIVDEYGDDVFKWVEGINEANIRILNLPADSDNCYIFAVDTVYGATQYYHYDYDMPAYSGNFAISQYVLSEGDSAISVNFTPATDAETLFVEFDVFPGFQFYAAYDEAAQTLTLDGWAYGYEQYKSLFLMGLPLGPDDANPYLCFVPFADETGENVAENLVIKLSENAPAQLDTYFTVFTANAKVELTGVVCEFTPAAVFSPAASTLALTHSAEFKAMNVESTSEYVELAEQQIVVKPYSGNYVREYDLSKMGSLVF